MTKVINFAAGPSAGKTTAGLRLSSILKARRYDVLYVPEFAMQMVVHDRVPEMDDQLYILGQQAHMLYMAKDKFDYVVTDSPLFMYIYYGKKGLKKYSESYQHTYERLVRDTFFQYENYTYFVERGGRKFLQLGRLQTEEESIAIDREILDIMNNCQIDYRKVEDADDALDNLQTRGIVPYA